MRIKDVIRQCEEAVEANFANYDWSEAAENAAIRIADGDLKLARKVAVQARKLPRYAVDEEGVQTPFLCWEILWKPIF